MRLIRSLRIYTLSMRDCVFGTLYRTVEEMEPCSAYTRDIAADCSAVFILIPKQMYCKAVTGLSQIYQGAIIMQHCGAQHSLLSAFASKHLKHLVPEKFISSLLSTFSAAQFYLLGLSHQSLATEIVKTHIPRIKKTGRHNKGSQKYKIYAKSSENSRLGSAYAKLQSVSIYYLRFPNRAQIRIQHHLV